MHDPSEVAMRLSRIWDANGEITDLLCETAELVRSAQVPHVAGRIGPATARLARGNAMQARVAARYGTDTATLAALVKDSRITVLRDLAHNPALGEQAGRRLYEIGLEHADIGVICGLIIWLDVEYLLNRALAGVPKDFPWTTLATRIYADEPDMMRRALTVAPERFAVPFTPAVAAGTCELDGAELFGLVDEARHTEMLGGPIRAVGDEYVARLLVERERDHPRLGRIPDQRSRSWRPTTAQVAHIWALSGVERLALAAASCRELDREALEALLETDSLTVLAALARRPGLDTADAARIVRGALTKDCESIAGFAALWQIPGLCHETRVGLGKLADTESVRAFLTGCYRHNMPTAPDITRIGPTLTWSCGREVYQRLPSARRDGLSDELAEALYGSCAWILRCWLDNPGAADACVAFDEHLKARLAVDLADDTVAWQAFLTLAPAHTGSLDELVARAMTVAR